MHICPEPFSYTYSFSMYSHVSSNQAFQQTPWVSQRSDREIMNFRFFHKTLQLEFIISSLRLQQARKGMLTTHHGVVSASLPELVCKCLPCVILSRHEHCNTQYSTKFEPDQLIIDGQRAHCSSSRGSSNLKPMLSPNWSC